MCTSYKYPDVAVYCYKGAVYGLIHSYRPFSVPVERLFGLPDGRNMLTKMFEKLLLLLKDN